jgi:hypothetical protein
MKQGPFRMTNLASAAASPSQSWLSLWLIFSPLAAALLTIIFIVWPTERDRRMSAACDQAFESLITTKDLVEFERAKFLLDKGWCSVSARMGLK